MADRNPLVAHLMSGSRNRRDAVFLVFPDRDETVTFDAFFVRAERHARVLSDHGVTPGERVAVQVEKSAEALALYLGTLMAGGVFLPLNTAYTDEEIRYFVGNAEPALVVCDPAREPGQRAIATEAGARAVLTLGADGSGTLTDAVGTAQDGFTPVARSTDDLAVILYTSGTTGRSKGAMLSHGNLISNSATLADLWRFTPDDRLIHALPIYHAHGLFVALNTALVAGSSLRFHARFDAGAVVRDLPNATAMMGVPTFYVRLLQEPGLAEAARPIRLFVSGSAPLLAETHRDWQAVTGHAILERYGMSETGMNSSNPYDGERRPGTVGPPLPGVEIRVADPETGTPLPAGEIGSVEVRGPNVFKGYWRLPEKTATEFRADGFFITGDLGQFDAEGYLSLVGRSKDLIISGGFNVYPKEIEALIDDLPGVAESAVIGVPHPDFGEGVVAVVVPAAGKTPRAEDILGPLGGRLAKFKQPKKIFFVEALPRNTMGKVQKNVLRDSHADAFAS